MLLLLVLALKSVAAFLVFLLFLTWFCLENVKYGLFPSWLLRRDLEAFLRGNFGLPSEGLLALGSRREQEAYIRSVAEFKTSRVLVKKVAQILIGEVCKEVGRGKIGGKEGRDDVSVCRTLSAE